MGEPWLPGYNNFRIPLGTIVVRRLSVYQENIKDETIFICINDQTTAAPLGIPPRALVVGVSITAAAPPSEVPPLAPPTALPYHHRFCPANIIIYLHT